MQDSSDFKIVSRLPSPLDGLDRTNGVPHFRRYCRKSRRYVDAFTNIVRDPRVTRNAPDELLNKLAGFGRSGGVDDIRLNSSSSCMGCHIDGMNRANNDLRDWLDAGGNRLPKGPNGVDGWVNNPDTVKRVRELYPPSSEMRVKMEDDRRVFLNAMAQIKQEMILGVDKNAYVEPIIWTAEWAQRYYKYPVTRSN